MCEREARSFQTLAGGAWPGTELGAAGHEYSGELVSVGHRRIPSKTGQGRLVAATIADTGTVVVSDVWPSMRRREVPYFLPQGGHRIDARRAARGNQTRQEGDSEESGAGHQTAER